MTGWSDKDSGFSEGMALALSGGGYRAMLFHTGVVMRINELGLLKKLERISSVSGGSLTAALLAKAWKDLTWVDGKAVNLTETFVQSVLEAAENTFDIPTALVGAITGNAGQKLAEHYEEKIFGSMTLQELPDNPRFVFNSTSYLSGVDWRFSKPYMGDYKTGLVANPEVKLAVAAAASSAFPPFLSPLLLKCAPVDPSSNAAEMLEVELGDGGVYDNLGLEPVLKNFRTLIVSDAGQFMAELDDIGHNWIATTLRTFSIGDSQVRALRRRMLMGAFESTDPVEKRNGAFWSMRTNIEAFKTPGSLTYDTTHAKELADVPTRLSDMSKTLKRRLINYGYALSDAGLRAYVTPGAPAPTGYPYPDQGV